jgi:hypothetical protein
MIALSALVYSAPGRAGGVGFTRDIAPILLRKCTGCHGERSNLGGYRAHTFEALVKPGASGLRTVVPGEPETSRLYQLLTSKVEPLRMPKSDDPLPPAQIELIRKWIAEGARFDGADRSAPLRSLLGARVHPPAPAVYRSPTPVLALALLPRGEYAAAGGYNEVVIWNIAAGVPARRIGNLPQRIQAISFSREGKTMLVAGGTPGEYGEVSLVEMDSPSHVRVLDTWPDACLTAVFSPDGSRIAAGGADNSVRVYDSATGKRLWSSGVHSDWVTSVSFSADGKFVASAGRDMTVKVNDAATGELFTTYSGHNRQIGQYAEHSPVYAVRAAAEGATFFSAGAGKWVQRWDPLKAKAESGDAGDMEERFSKQSHAAHLAHGFAHEVFALSVQGGSLFAASADGIVKQFDLASMNEIRAFNADREWLFSLDYDSASGRLAAGSYGGQVHIWDIKTGKLLAEFFNQPGAKGFIRQHSQVRN